MTHSRRWLLGFLLLSTTLALTAEEAICPYGCPNCYPDSSKCIGQCRAAWFKNSSGVCETCTLHCSTCNNTQTCIECSSGYSINGQGKCQFDQQPSSNHSLVVGLCLGLGIPFGGLFLYFMWVLVYSCCCGQRPEPQNNAEAEEGDYNLFKEAKERDWVYNSSDSKLNYYDQCGICRQSGVQLRTVCNHGFHLNCFEEEIKNGKQCRGCDKSPYPVDVYCRACKKSYQRVHFPTSSSFSSSNVVCGQCSNKQ